MSGRSTTWFDEIQPGIGFGALHFGMSPSQVLSRLGEAPPSLLRESLAPYPVSQTILGPVTIAELTELVGGVARKDERSERIDLYFAQDAGLACINITQGPALLFSQDLFATSLRDVGGLFAPHQPPPIAESRQSARWRVPALSLNLYELEGQLTAIELFAASWEPDLKSLPPSDA